MENVPTPCGSIFKLYTVHTEQNPEIDKNIEIPDFLLFPLLAHVDEIRDPGDIQVLGPELANARFEVKRAKMAGRCCVHRLWSALVNGAYDYPSRAE